jgi:hypothetical protein
MGILLGIIAVVLIGLYILFRRSSSVNSDNNEQDKPTLERAGLVKSDYHD